MRGEKIYALAGKMANGIRVDLARGFAYSIKWRSGGRKMRLYQILWHGAAARNSGHIKYKEFMNLADSKEAGGK